jgi:hypothetical protein
MIFHGFCNSRPLFIHGIAKQFVDSSIVSAALNKQRKSLLQCHVTCWDKTHLIESVRHQVVFRGADVVHEFESLLDFVCVLLKFFLLIPREFKGVNQVLASFALCGKHQSFHNSSEISGHPNLDAVNKHYPQNWWLLHAPFNAPLSIPRIHPSQSLSDAPFNTSRVLLFIPLPLLLWLWLLWLLVSFPTSLLTELFSPTERPPTLMSPGGPPITAIFFNLYYEFCLFCHLVHITEMVNHFFCVGPFHPLLRGPLQSHRD